MKNSIRNYLRDHPPAAEIFKKIELAGDVILIGGILREFLDHNKIQNLRDIDIIVDVKTNLNGQGLLRNILSEQIDLADIKFSVKASW